MSTQRADAKLQDDSAGTVLTETPMTTSQSVGGLSFHAHHTVYPLVICQQKSVHKVDIRGCRFSGNDRSHIWMFGLTCRELSVMTGRVLTTAPVRGHAAVANIR